MDFSASSQVFLIERRVRFSASFKSDSEQNARRLPRGHYYRNKYRNKRHWLLLQWPRANSKSQLS
jgi:hypothetical protein